MADHPKHDAPTETPRRVVRVVGRYQLARLLGEGAMGRVYLATDPELGRDVAIKVLRLDQAGSARDAYIARFRNEARAAARFNHPNVVSVHDAGVCPTLGPYLVYEYIPGPTLRATLDRGRLDAADLVRIARGVAAALDALRAAKIVHRDVKPDNILLAPDGRVKLTDFGIARVPDASLTRDGQFLGTPAYAAPEAIARGEYGHRGDLFSLAAVLYESLTGTRPFPGDDAVTVSYAVVNDPVRPPSELVPALPAGVDEVFSYGLAKSPDERYANARALADALAQAILPRAAARSAVPAAASAKPPPARRTQPPRSARAPATKGVGPAVLIALALAAGLVLAARNHGTRPAETPVALAPPAAQPQLAGVPMPGFRGGAARVRPRRLAPQPVVAPRR